MVISMTKRTQRIMIRAAAAAAAPALAIGLASGPSAAVEATPDDEWVPFTPGSVMWNDYDSEDPSIDYDNVKIDDRGGDGLSASVTAYNQSTQDWDSAHAYNGESVELDIGNVRKGASVTYYVCTWNGGSKRFCSDNYRFIE